MFRRISGSSSMTKIFLIAPSESGKPYQYRGPFTAFAFQLHARAVQVRATFHQQQAEACARTRSHIASSMKGLEQVLLIFVPDPNSFVTNLAHGVAPVPLDDKMHGGSCFGVLHTVAQKVGKNMPQQAFVRMRLSGNGT